MSARTFRPLFVLLVLLLAALACNLPGGKSPAPATAVVSAPTADMTRVALEYQATQMSLQLTQAADAAQQPTAIPPTQPPVVVNVTQIVPTSEPPKDVQPTAAQATATQDVSERMKKAKILVYEDTPGIGLWISDALDGLGLKYVHVGDAIGHLMENLNSSIKWDLIIIGAESKTKVQGEFWDVIGEKVARDKTALIAEVWYLDLLGEGRIKTVMANCGIEFQRDWPLAESIYWLDSSHPLFSDPNETTALINYSRYWQAQAGDLIRLSPGSNATLLAGTFQKRKSDYGVLATCLEGRVVFQTFSNHDYHQDAIIRLWQNYITYTLKNRFAAVP
jgi:hypothetical protein